MRPSAPPTAPFSDDAGLPGRVLVTRRTSRPAGRRSRVRQVGRIVLTALVVLAGLALAPAAALAAGQTPTAASGVPSAPASSAGLESGSAAALRARYATLQDVIAKNAFGRPLAMISVEESDRIEGDITARADYPFADVAKILDGTARWCEILILHLNTKACGAEPTALHMRVGRKYDQPAEDAYALDFAYHADVMTSDYLHLRLTAAEGPMGTRDYRIDVEATPLDAGHTIILMRYAYGYGTTARIGMQTYLSTVGRSKVGFTVTGHDDAGKPEYIGGVRGLIERNTMRYYLAIDAVLATQALPPDTQLETRLANWFDGTERYPRQLHELDKSEYLAMKRDEIRRAPAAK
jgi:hypothetical protein